MGFSKSFKFYMFANYKKKFAFMNLSKKFVGPNCWKDSNVGLD